MAKSGFLMGVVLIIILFACIALVNAAVIKGNLYDFSLNKIGNAVVEVNSSPKQTWVSKQGDYAFVLEPGSYTIMAVQKSGTEILAKAEEKINIKTDGEFVLDLILFPVIEESELDIDLDVTNPLEEKKEYSSVEIAIASAVIILIALIVFIAVKKLKKKKTTGKKTTKTKKKERKIESKEKKIKEEPTQESRFTEPGQIINILKKHDGRATQKEIRKEIPLSEAKISLMISELENEGKIKKIKKGRGNIIILTK